MKEFDVRKIYLCEMLKQKEVYERKNEDYTDILFYQERLFDWDYEQESRLGLFVKSLGGFKHILTGVVYPKASRKTGNRYVVNPKNIELLAKEEPAMVSDVIQRKSSFYVNLLEVSAMEEKINKERKSEDVSEM